MTGMPRLMPMSTLFSTSVDDSKNSTKHTFKTPMLKNSIGTSPRQKMHTLCQRPAEEPTEEIEQRQSADMIPSGEDIISKLAATPDLKN